jgi:hypothetical protein
MASYLCVSPGVQVVIVLLENYDAVFGDIERERLVQQAASRKAEEELRDRERHQREQYLSSLPTKSVRTRFL